MSTEIALVHQDVYDRFVEVMQRVIDSDVDALGEFSMINAAGASKPKELWADALSKVSSSSPAVLTKPRVQRSSPSTSPLTTRPRLPPRS